MKGDGLNNVRHIGISGQMHGVLFWNDDKDESGYNRHSNLITWMDQRCNADGFIESLPKMPSYLVIEMLVNGQHLSEGTEIGSQIVDKQCEIIFYLSPRPSVHPSTQRRCNHTSTVPAPAPDTFLIFTAMYLFVYKYDNDNPWLPIL